MTIVEGTRFGPYEIVSLRGAGGMGEVYGAREARTISALNHPNICTLHDVAPDYLVMELVEGASLEDLIGRSGRVAVRDALRIARQIAGALEAAHDRGIVPSPISPAAPTAPTT